MNYRNTYLEVDLSKITHNYNTYLEETKKDIFAVVKANAYGLGITEVAKHFETLNATYICVATLDEAIKLRKDGLTSPLLVMGHTASKYLDVAKQYNITITVISLDYVKEIVTQDLKGLKLHLKVNTSMNRIGLNNREEVQEAINLLKDNHQLEGIFTHYCCNDETLAKDFEQFKGIVSSLDYDFKYIHASSSFSSLILKESFTNACRIGIGLYGGINTHGLNNVARLLTEVIALRPIEKDKTVSYGGVYKTQKHDIIATLPIGYADGILRSDRGNNVFINNKAYEIVGNICMDQMMIRVDQHVALYDQVEVFGNHTTITDIANKRNTINYEVLTTISSRVPRIYINSEDSK